MRGKTRRKGESGEFACDDRIRIYYRIYGGPGMSTTPQKRAIKRYRKRLGDRGMARFEVLGLNTDRDLIRTLARRLADNDVESSRIRATIQQTVSGAESPKGGILAALRRSPLVGADLNLSRPPESGRKVDL